MLTIIVLVLALLVAAVVVAWWWLEIDVPDVVVAATAPAAGVCLIYFYGTLLSWAIGVASFLIGGFYLLYKWRRDAKQPPDS
jgi:hypothetical protein